jgi:hypothetical protein
MRVPARIRILVSSLGLAAVAILSVVATAFADSAPGPFPR